MEERGQELTGNAIAQFEILVMMSEVILLHVSHVLRELRVMKTKVPKMSKPVTETKREPTRNACSHNRYLDERVNLEKIDLQGTRRKDSQKVKAPEMIPLATATGNSL